MSETGPNYNNCFACEGQADLVLQRDNGLIVPFCKECAGNFLEMASVKNPRGELSCYFREEADYLAVNEAMIRDREQSN